MKIEPSYLFPDDDAPFQPFLIREDYQILQHEMGLGVCRALEEPFHVAVDIGANVGLWARPLAGVFEKVICFEPRASHVDCLRKNLEGLNCDIHPVGLSDGATQEARTLDSFAIPEINFIRIRAPGLEPQVLQGGEETLSRTRPVILCENTPHRWELVHTFIQLGFERILRMVKEDIYVHSSRLSLESRRRIMLYFNEHRTYFEGITSRQ